MKRKRMKKNQIEIGHIDIPVEYNNFTDYKKNVLCDKIIESMIIQLDKELPEHISRMVFLIDVLKSSLITNEEDENYEICSLIRDILKRLDD
jgi:hypothetical protein